MKKCVTSGNQADFESIEKKSNKIVIFKWIFFKWSQINISFFLIINFEKDDIISETNTKCKPK